MDLIINLYKPRGITSQQAVTRVKRLLGVKKAGHTGTLDPLATGVLLICLNEATKVSRFFLDMDKRYRARVKLGERTDTFDAEGKIIETADASQVREGDLLRVVRGFRGQIEQKPPMYSAVKISGKPLYVLARQGIEADRKTRTVSIYDINVSGIDLPFFDLDVACSKGTYIRTLCDDIGRVLGPGAHLSALERLSVGSFRSTEALSFDDLSSNSLVPDGRSVFTIDAGLPDMHEIFLDEAESWKVRQGQRIPVTEKQGDPGPVSCKIKGPDGGLIGFGSIISGLIVIERILNLQVDFSKC